MQRFALFAFAFIGLAACETPISAPTPRAPSVAGPSFAKILNEKFPISSIVFNPCPPAEPVAFEGTFHEVVTGEVSPTSIDIKVHLNTQELHGVGLVTGDRYEVIENEKADEEFSTPPPRLDETIDLRERLIRQGSLDNFWFRVTEHVTFPPLKIEIIRLEVECRG
jgi:hypothetical protein